MNKITKRIKLILEGKTIKDKFKILFSVFLLNKYRPSVYLKNRDGLFFVRKNSSDLWMLSTLGEAEIRDYFKLNEGCFLDIGANVGKYSVIIAKQLKDKGFVLCFEPEPKNLIALKRNLLLNKLNNVNIVPIALSDRKGNIDFYLNSENTGGHSLVNKTKNKITVKSDKLDNVIKQQNVRNIKLIKIDVEGAEMKVLKGAENLLKKDHPKIIFETDYPEIILPYLKKFHYNIKKISDRDYFAN